MSNVLNQIRSKYPQYAGVPDPVLVQAIGQKYSQYLQHEDFAAEFQAANAKQPSQPLISLNANPSEGGVPPGESFNVPPSIPLGQGRGNPALALLGESQLGPYIANSMQPGVGKALMEQVNAPNALLAMVAPQALMGPKAVSYPLRALFAAQGAAGVGQALGQEFSGPLKPKAGYPLPYVPTNPNMDQGQKNYLTTQALLSGLQTLATPGLEKPIESTGSLLGDFLHVLRHGQERGLVNNPVRPLGSYLSVQPYGPLQSSRPPVAPPTAPSNAGDVTPPAPQESGSTAVPVKPSSVKVTALPYPKGIPVQPGLQFYRIEEPFTMPQGDSYAKGKVITSGELQRFGIKPEVQNEQQATLPEVQQTPSQPQVAGAPRLTLEEQNTRLHDFARDLSRVQAQAALRGQLQQFGNDVRPALQHLLSMRSRIGQLTEQDFNQSDQMVQQLRSKYATAANAAKPGQRRPIGLPAKEQKGQSQVQGQKAVQTGPQGIGQVAPQGVLRQEVSGGQPSNAGQHGEGGGAGAGVLSQERRNKELANLLGGKNKKASEAGSVFPRFGDSRDETRAAWMNRSGETKWFNGGARLHKDELPQGETLNSYMDKGNLRVNVYGDKLAFDSTTKPTDKQLGELKNLAIEMDKTLINSQGKVIFEPRSVRETDTTPRSRASEAGAVFPRFGVSRRATAERAAQGALPQEPEPGDVMEPEELVERGRQLLAQGVDPEKTLEQAVKGGYTSPDVIAVTRAKGEELAKAASATAIRYGVDSPEYKAAQAKDYDWIARTKPLGTTAGESMRALQGTTALDTGDFHSMARTYKAETGEDFTPVQAREAQEHVKANTEATAEVMKAKTRLEDMLNQLLKKFVGGQEPEVPPRTGERGSIFPRKDDILEEARMAGAKRTQNEAAAIWEYAKRAYLEKGFKGTFDEMAQRIAIDLGASKRQVVEALFKPKGMKEVSDNMYRAMDKQRRVKQAAEAWLQRQKIPWWAQAVRSIPTLFFMDKIFLHGTVLPTTHAAVNLFHPERLGNWVRAYTQGWKMAYSSVKHEQWVQDMVTRQNFTLWKRAGLAVDPERYYEDYQNAMMKSWWSKMNVLTGKYGADSLKEMRFLFAEHIWDNAPHDLKFKGGKVNREFTKQIATMVNHATGVVQGKLPEAMNWAFFAPRLEGSRWAWLLGDTAKAATTFARWDKATPEEKWFAQSKAKEMAWIVGTYYGLLALNQGILSASGSPQRINFTDPHRSDFMSFKVAGHNVGVVGPMLGLVRLFANLIHDSVRPQKKLEAAGLSSRREAITEDASHYVTSKLSPFGGFALDTMSQSDYRGRPLPWSQDQPPLQLKRAGIGKYTPSEYVASTFLPIPFEEGIKEVWMSQGMTPDLANRLWLGLMAGAVTATTGARVEPDLSTEPKPGPPHKEPFQIKPPSFKGKRFSMGDILKRGGKQYMVTGFDEDGHPLVDEVGQEPQAA